MATATVKLTNYTTVKLTYNIANVSNTATRLTVTGYTFTNTRTDGTTQKVWVDVEGFEASYATRFDDYYEPSNTTFAIAKGTKSKTGSITRWYQWTRTHSARTGQVMFDVYMDNEDGDYWAKSVTVSVSVPARPSYTVTLNGNGGSGGSLTKWYGETLTLSTNPSWSGHTFKGWGTGKTSTSVAYARNASYTANAAITLYAIWTCTISYDANGGQLPEELQRPQSKYAYTNIPLYTEVPTWDGYDFKGWATSSGGEVAYQPGALYTSSDGATLYAVWAVTPPTVSVKVERAVKDETDDTYTPSLIGGYGLVTVTYSLSSAIVTPAAVSCSVGGEAATPVSSSGTTAVYASASPYGLTEQPTVEVSVSDAASNVTTKTLPLPTAAPPIYFKPGGDGVAFGEPAVWPGFRVAMKPYFGEYPVKDTSDDYLLIVGNGTADNARSNAMAVDRDGYLYPCNEKMPDFVVEQGASGIWTYRKWHSGIMECWGTYTASMAINVTSGPYGGYRSAQITAPAYPFAFTAQPVASAIVSYNSQGAWVNNGGGTASNFMYYLSCGASLAAASRSVSIHAIGRWK